MGLNIVHPDGKLPKKNLFFTIAPDQIAFGLSHIVEESR